MDVNALAKVEHRLVIPGRARSLNAERKGHHMARHADTDAWRHAAKMLAVSERNKGLLPRMRPGVTITAVPYTKPPLADTGNHYPTIKACIDGLQDAQIIEDDNADWVAEIRLRAPQHPMGDPERVVLIISGFTYKE